MANNKRINKFGGHGPRQDRRARHREEAMLRLADWRELSPQARLATLDRRLGVGVGARKQRARIGL